MSIVFNDIWCRWVKLNQRLRGGQGLKLTVLVALYRIGVHDDPEHVMIGVLAEVLVTPAVVSLQAIRRETHDRDERFGENVGLPPAVISRYLIAQFAADVGVAIKAPGHHVDGAAVTLRHAAPVGASGPDINVQLMVLLLDLALAAITPGLHGRPALLTG